VLTSLVFYAEKPNYSDVNKSKKIHADGEGHMESVPVTDQRLKKSLELLFLTLGMLPNNPGKNGDHHAPESDRHQAFNFQVGMKENDGGSQEPAKHMKIEPRFEGPLATEGHETFAEHIDIGENHDNKPHQSQVPADSVSEFQGQIEILEIRLVGLQIKEKAVRRLGL
jgi:hypothetical protein